MKNSILLSSLAAMLLLMGGCSAGGGGDSSDGGSNDDGYYDDGSNDDGFNDDGSNDDGSNDDGSYSSAPPSFNISGAKALYTTSDMLEEVPQSSITRDAKKLFTYKVTEDSALREDTQGSTNLLSVDENGEATSAIDSELPVKVMYTAVNPVNGLVYIALDNGWYDYDYSAGDLSASIAQNNCAFYEINATSNASTCVVEGKFLQNYNDAYYQTVSGNQKPIQFDGNGSVYFLATSFTVEGEDDYKYINSSDWNPILYKYSASTQETENITQDNESVNFYTVLKYGDVVYQSTDTSDWTTILNMKKSDSDSIINLTGDTWGVDFFTVDSEETVIFGQYNWYGSGSNGIRLVQPGAVGVKKTSLNTSLFGANNNGTWQDPSPKRIIVADDGNIYGVFQGGKNVYDDDGAWSSWETTLSVYQVLPFDPIPKAELSLGTNDWWSWMGETPFQISKGFLFYKETKENVIVSGESLGSADYIQMVNLNTRETTTILNPATATDPRYNVYSWRLSGQELYFSALDKSVNIVKTGKIDTVKVKNGEAESEYLTLQETASAVGADSSIKDISVIKPQAPDADTGSAPSIVTDGIHLNSENPYSVSVEFSKYMDRETVADYLNIVSSDITEGTDGVIPYIPVWVYKTLHLIPDLSTDSLGDSISQGFTAATTYTLDFQDGIQDSYGWYFDEENSDENITMAPTNGWYNGDTTTSNTSISSAKVATFAGTTADSWEPESYKLADLASGETNFRVEFSAKNFSYHMGQIVLWENSASDDYWTERVLSLEMSSYSSVQYKTALGSEYAWEETPNVADGNWKQYRVDVYANTFTFSLHNGTQWEEISTYTDLKDRSANAHQILYRLSEKISIDNLLVSTLNADGTLNGAEGDIVDEDFTTLPTVEPKLDTELIGDTALDGWNYY